MPELAVTSLDSNKKKRTAIKMQLDIVPICRNKSFSSRYSTAIPANRIKYIYEITKLDSGKNIPRKISTEINTIRMAMNIFEFQKSLK